MANSKKQVALITGANKGIGFETARQLGKKGYVVVLGAREQQKGDEAAGKLQGEGVEAHALKLEVTNTADHAAAAEFLKEKFGKLDVLVNNAGVFLDGGLGENHTSTTSLDVLRKTFETNLFGPVALTQALLPLLKASEGGRVVNLTSSLGSLTLHSDPQSLIYQTKPLAYDSSKAALNMFTVHLAHELRDTKIKVNSADPGWVKTDMGTSAAPLEVEDGAKTSVDLATLGPDGLTGAFVHMGKPVPW